MSKFKVGDKVTPIVCLQEGIHPYLVEGSVYTVVRAEFDSLAIVGTPSTDVADRGALNFWCFDWSEEHFKLVEENEEMTAEQIREEILRMDSRIEEAKKDIENAEKERSVLVEKLREKGFELSGKMQDRDCGYNVCTVDNVKEGDILILTEESWNNDIPSGSQVRVIKNDFSDIPLKIKTLDGLYEDWTKIDTVKFK